MEKQWKWSDKPTKEEEADKALLTGSLTQTEEQTESDPICSSAFHPDCIDPSKKGKKEVVYPIYPLDKDMKDTDDHIKKQEIIHGEWVIPPKDEEKIQTESSQKLSTYDQRREMEMQMKSNWGTF